MEKNPPNDPLTANFPFSVRRPEGDTHERHVCDACGWIHYVNPKVVVGSVVTSGTKFLLCRRAIEPRKGFWTLPAGFLEVGESAEEGAKREAREEAEAEIEINALLAVYSVTHISQIQIMFRAELMGGIAPGPESLEVGLFEWTDIPWEEIAFPSVKWALTQWREVEGQAGFAAFTNPKED